MRRQEKQALLGLVEKAVGKQIVPVENAVVPEDEDDDEDSEAIEAPAEA
ncbi:MAG: hypothetical protein KDK97_24415 [Verrucomicrobiales bacterium]|nr:hypothetical protein [Verrucomicrobiales bacterium]MCP5556694.1 hypothetical protein [Verrucomicrobiaceae bacterium]